MKASNILILGFGGHARAVADIALSCGFTSLLFYDANARIGENFLGHEVVGKLPDDINWPCIPASGDADTRKCQLEEAIQRGWRVATLVSPHASVGPGSSIGAGTVVGHHAHVGPMARIGTGCIINTGAIVEHESVVGDFTHISLNSAIAGRSFVGRNVFIGAGATVADKVAICDGVTIGAGAVVVSSISVLGTYVGVPAKPLDGQGNRTLMS
jgi:sugar O-acyltransferase (sialic acid O-acetyltransferase NeuD family)